MRRAWTRTGEAAGGRWCRLGEDVRQEARRASEPDRRSDSLGRTEGGREGGEGGREGRGVDVRPVRMDSGWTGSAARKPKQLEAAGGLSRQVDEADLHLVGLFNITEI